MIKSNNRKSSEDNEDLDLDQVNMGIKMIINSYESKVKKLNTDIQTLKQQLTENNLEMNRLSQNNSKLEKDLNNEKNKNANLVSENRILANNLEKLQRENLNLNQLKSNILTAVNTTSSAEGFLDQSNLRKNYSHYVAAENEDRQDQERDEEADYKNIEKQYSNINISPIDTKQPLSDKPTPLAAHNLNQKYNLFSPTHESRFTNNAPQSQNPTNIIDEIDLTLHNTANSQQPSTKSRNAYEQPQKEVQINNQSSHSQSSSHFKRGNTYSPKSSSTLEKKMTTRELNQVLRDMKSKEYQTNNEGYIQGLKQRDIMNDELQRKLDQIQMKDSERIKRTLYHKDYEFPRKDNFQEYRSTPPLTGHTDNSMHPSDYYSQMEGNPLYQTSGNTPARERNLMHFDFDYYSSPTSPRSPQFIDGKAFFKEARMRLSFENFDNFLNNIKMLNVGQQTKDETLDNVKMIFGIENKDLVKKFEKLLIRHIN